MNVLILITSFVVSLIVKQKCDGLEGQVKSMFITFSLSVPSSDKKM